MTLDDTLVELMNAKGRAEEMVVGVMWASPWTWCRRARERGIWPGVFDDMALRCAVVVAEYRAVEVCGHGRAERLLAALVKSMDLQWDDLAMRATIYRFTPGEAGRIGESVLDELADKAKRLNGVRQAMASIARLTDWRQTA